MPLAIDELPALILIDCSMAGVIVRSTVLEVIPFWVAVMFAEPIARPLARPAELILAMAGLELVHVTLFVRFCVLPSL